MWAYNFTINNTARSNTFTILRKISASSDILKNGMFKTIGKPSKFNIRVEKCVFLIQLAGDSVRSGPELGLE